MCADDKNEYEFHNSELLCRFNITPPTLHRALKYGLNYGDITFIKLDKIGNKLYKVKFYDNGKKKNAIKTNQELKKWIITYYKERDIDYVDISNHKKYVDMIYQKIEKAIKQRGKFEVNEDICNDTFKMFFKKLPNWWLEHAFTLPTINKNFTKILNQIKFNSNGKQSNYVSAEKNLDIDFEKLKL
jgi:hypothetical protein